MDSMSQGQAAEATSRSADGDLGLADIDGDSDAGGAYQADDFGGYNDQDAGIDGPFDQGDTLDMSPVPAQLL